MTSEENALVLTSTSSDRVAALNWRVAVASVLAALVALSLAVQALGVFHRNVNWDEFLFLSNVYRVVNGQPVGLLQTAYTHLFTWLVHIGGGEIVQITVARAIYVAIWAGSLVLLYRLSRRLLDSVGALCSVVLFALFSFCVTHAASFRIDGLLLPVLLSAALLLMEPSRRRMVAAGALVGLSFAFTIKAALWAPTFAGLVAIALWNGRGRLQALLSLAGAAVATFAGIMLIHSWWLSLGSGPPPGVSAHGLAGIGTRMFLEDGLLPRYEVFVHAVVENLMTWVLIVAGLAIAVVELRAPPARRQALILLVLAMPIVSIVLYANAWPYAYLVLMPGACLLAGRAFSHFLAGGSGLRTAAAGISLIVVALPMAVSAWSLRVDQRQYQQEILSLVHGLFKEPVPYIDKGGMIPSFPRQPLFMSRWGMKNYHDASVSVLARYIRDTHPPLLIVNTPVLNVWDENTMRQIDPHFKLRPKDVDALRDTYAPYWGPIYLAGKQWRGLGADESVSFKIIIPGDYTLIARHPARVEGRIYVPGATVSLQAGDHALTTTGTETDLRLLWGTGTTVPAEVPSEMPIYTGL